MATIGQLAVELGVLPTHVQSHPGLYPLLALCPLLQAVEPRATLLGLHLLRADVVRALHRGLQQAEPGADDHCLQDVEWVCHCPGRTIVINWAE